MHGKGTPMNKPWLGSVAIAGIALGIAGQAQSADLPLGAPAVVPIAAPIVNWSGLYVGANAGFATSRLRYSIGIPDGGCETLCEDFRFTPTSFIGGGQVGWQSQVDQWVLGIEGTWSGLDLHESRASILDPTSG